MLRELRVSDLAIIDRAAVAFGDGFTVVTGETGAGKSILLDAISLVLGQRADAEQVRSGAAEAVLEAEFANLSDRVCARLRAAGCAVDQAAPLLVRRTVAASGRSRAFLNGAQVAVGVLREIGPLLLRIYGQDDDQALRRVETHLDLVDGAGGLGSAVGEMRRRHARLETARAAVREHERRQRDREERLELLHYQHDELARVAPVAGEYEALTQEQRRLTHAERLAMLVAAAEACVYSGETAAVGSVGRALTELRAAERLDAGVADARALLESALAEVEEAGQALGRHLGAIAPDPDRLAVVEDRLAALDRLRRKHGGTLDDVFRRQREIAAELAGVHGGQDRLQALVAECEAAEREAQAWAKQLAVERRRVARQLERLLTRELRALALGGARFEVRFADAESAGLGPLGRDQIEFFLAANAGEEPRPLVKVASGGERSRVMLALKAASPADDHEATLVFDEVDTGVGGAIGEVIGRKLRQLGQRRQVLAVTHLPVVAAFSDHHVAVGKTQAGGRTVSTARALSAAERVTELARMLAGARVTPEVREHARQLLQQRDGDGVLT